MPALGFTPQLIADEHDRCGEGPIWDFRTNILFWNDITARTIHEIDLSGKVKTTTPGPQPSGMALAAGGGLVIGGADGIHLVRNNQTSVILPDLDGKPAPWNDILATPTGKLYAGTHYWGESGLERPGHLYLVDAVKKSAVVVDDGIELSNGIGLSPDGKTLYYADSTTRKIYAYDVSPKDETLSRKRVFVQVPLEEGVPDGLTVDANGFIWSAQWYGSQVVRYDPDGRVERRVPLPVKQVSSVAFGGEQLDTLFITTAGEHWESNYKPRGYPAKPEAIGGPLFAMKPVVRGRREYEVKV